LNALMERSFTFNHVSLNRTLFHCSEMKPNLHLLDMGDARLQAMATKTKRSRRTEAYVE
jgi:hypothetical protein